MEFASINLLNFLIVTPNLVPKVFQQPFVSPKGIASASHRNPIAIDLGSITGALSRYYFSF